MKKLVGTALSMLVLMAVLFAAAVPALAGEAKPGFWDQVSAYPDKIVAHKDTFQGHTTVALWADFTGWGKRPIIGKQEGDNFVFQLPRKFEVGQVLLFCFNMDNDDTLWSPQILLENGVVKHKYKVNDALPAGENLAMINRNLTAYEFATNFQKRVQPGQ